MIDETQRSLTVSYRPKIVLNTQTAHVVIFGIGGSSVLWFSWFLPSLFSESRGSQRSLKIEQSKNFHPGNPLNSLETTSSHIYVARAWFWTFPAANHHCCYHFSFFIIITIILPTYTIQIYFTFFA